MGIEVSDAGSNPKLSSAAPKSDPVLTALENARSGKYPITTTNNPQAYKYVADQLRSGLSDVYRSSSDADVVRLIQSVSGVAETDPIIGAETMKSFDVFTNAVKKSTSSSPREKTMAGLKSIAGMYDSKTLDSADVSSKASKNLHDSSLWKSVVVDLITTGKGRKIVEGNNDKQCIQTLTESLQTLGLVPRDKSFSSYGGQLQDGIRKLNLLARGEKDLSEMGSLSSPVGEKTVAILDQALVFQSQGKNWRSQDLWVNFDYKAYVKSAK